MTKMLLLAVLAVTANVAIGQVAGDQGKTKDDGAKANVEQALVQMEREWGEALPKKDTAALDKILADDWVGQYPFGTMTKTQALAGIKSEDLKVESETMGEMKARVFGNTALVTGSDDEKSSFKGKDISGHYTWTDVFVKQNGRWRAVASQNTLTTLQ